MCFRFIFGRWWDKSVLISESIDGSDMSASENQVEVIKQVVEDQGGKKQRGWGQWWRIGCCGSQAFGTLLYASLNDVIHTTTRGQERWLCLLALLYWQTAMLQWWLHESTSAYVWHTQKKTSLVDFHLCYDHWFEILRSNTMLKLF